jgi:hypothetical protein
VAVSPLNSIITLRRWFSQRHVLFIRNTFMGERRVRRERAWNKHHPGVRTLFRPRVPDNLGDVAQPPGTYANNGMV